jgi:ABC-type multidrug transport system permease subunit
MSGQKFIQAVLTLIVYGIIFWVLWWALGYINPPEPFHKIAFVILVLGAVVVAINFLLSLIGKEFITWEKKE